MNKHLQIRSLAEATHRKLKMRASAEGLSMSDYIKRLIERDLARPGWDEIEARLARLTPVALPETSAEIIRHERDRR